MCLAKEHKRQPRRRRGDFGALLSEAFLAFVGLPRQTGASLEKDASANSAGFGERAIQVGGAELQTPIAPRPREGAGQDRRGVSPKKGRLTPKAVRGSQSQEVRLAGRGG